MKRQSNFELLRILAIVFVVMEHFITQSQLALGMSTGHHLVNYFLGSGARIAVNVFVILGAWFMVDARFRAERLVKMYLLVLFYSAPISLLMLFFGQFEGLRPIAQGLFPFFGRSVWFASAYISLYALSPILHKVLDLPERQLQLLSGLLLILFPLVATIPCSTPIDYLSDFAWFAVVYILVGWFKRTVRLDKINHTWVYLCGAIFIYLALATLKNIPLTAQLAHYWLDDIKSLPNSLCAVGIFIFVAKQDLGTNRFINLAARSVFAVYVIHQVPAFQQFEWRVVCHAEAIKNLPYLQYAGAILLTAFTLTTAYTLIDSIRITFLEPRYMTTKPIRWLIGKIDSLYSNFH